MEKCHIKKHILYEYSKLLNYRILFKSHNTKIAVTDSFEILQIGSTAILG